MRKLNISIILLALFILVPSIAAAAPITYTYSDNYKNWIGWEVDPRDNISNPLVGDMTIVVDGGYLKSISINVVNRLTWDSLFINTNWSGFKADYQSWDFYVRDDFYNTNTAFNGDAKIYSVDKVYEYLIVTNPNYRDGHPSGINLDPGKGLLDPGSATVEETFSGSTLLYEFTNVPITNSFVVGYSQFCANDVFLTRVPEPSTMLLLGLGLTGFAMLRKRD